MLSKVSKSVLQTIYSMHEKRPFFHICCALGIKKRSHVQKQFFLNY